MPATPCLNDPALSWLGEAEGLKISLAISSFSMQFSALERALRRSRPFAAVGAHDRTGQGVDAESPDDRRHESCPISTACHVHER